LQFSSPLVGKKCKNEKKIILPLTASAAYFIAKLYNWQLSRIDGLQSLKVVRAAIMK
jgi:hypothetical protein